MYNVVGVRFKPAGKIYYFDPVEYLLEKHSHVIVETSRGVEYGEIVVDKRNVTEDAVVLPLRNVIRKADEQDAEIVLDNRNRAYEAMRIFKEKVSTHKLQMKLVDAEYTFDRNKLIFYFTSDNRVDFRDLVKELASVFHVRIELRQIGVRDEAKILGGIGPCGRLLCCSTWMGEFDPVSIRMAKEQSLSLNPSKLSGLCGRLMCCLKFESDSYQDEESLV